MVSCYKERKFILISSVGRSGSTTLQRILNTIPNSNICGENYGMRDILRFYKGIKSTTEMTPGGKNPISLKEHIERGISPSWYNSYDYNKMVSMVKDIIINMFTTKNDEETIGFKDISLGLGPNSQLDVILILRELFPSLKVVIHVRNDTKSQAKSDWWARDQDAKKKIEECNQNLRDFYNDNKDFCYLSTYEDMFCFDKTRRLFSFLGHDADKNRINKILSNNLN
jgi:hypothetical protein